MKIPQKLKTELPHNPLILFLRYISEWIESRVSKRYLRAHVHTSSIISNSQELETTQMSTDGWTDKQNVLCTCNGIGIRHKKEGNSSRVTPQMNLDIMLSEINFSPPKDKYAMIPLMRYPKVVKFRETKLRMDLGKERNGELLFNRYISAFQIYKMKIFWW